MLTLSQRISVNTGHPYFKHVVAMLCIFLLVACGKQEPKNVAATTPATVASPPHSGDPPKPKEPEHKKPDFAPIPFDFKGVYLGASRSEVKKKFPKLVGLPSHKGGVSYELGDYFIFCGDNVPCKGAITIANQTPEYVEFQFYGDSVASLLIKFDNPYFSTVAQGLIEKFGPPQQMETTELTRILTGAKDDFIRMTWRFNKEGDIQSMVLKNHEQRGSNYLSSGVLAISSVAAELEHERRDNASGKKRNEKDL